MTIKAVIFDWGGTITPWEDLDLYDLWRAAATVLAPADPEPVVTALVKAENELWARSVASLRSASISDLLTAAANQLDIPVSDAVRDTALQQHLDAMTPHTVARPEAGTVLATIKQAGLATGLLSNTHWPRDWHERFLARDGLTDLIDVRVYSSELEHIKPHPEAFHAVLEKLGCRATESVFVGDRPIDDIAGAAQLGMRTIWLPNGRLTEADVAPDATANSLTDVPSIVESWRIDSG